MPGADGPVRRVCVFCGSKVGRRQDYAGAARALGEALVRRGWGLVFGGGRIGLMGVIAQTVLEGGGEVIGVIPRALSGKEIALHEVSELVVVDTMHQRKAVMADRSDAFVALPGGYGTCDETFEILTWAQLGIHRKPVGLLNTAGFFDPLLAWLDHMVGEDFLRPRYRRVLLTEPEPEALLDRLCDYEPDPTLPRWAVPGER